MSQNPYTNTMAVPALAPAARPAPPAPGVPAIAPAEAGLWGSELERSTRAAAGLIFAIECLVALVAGLGGAPVVAVVVVWGLVAVPTVLAPVVLRFWAILRMYNMQMSLFDGERRLRDLTLSALATPGGAGGDGREERERSAAGATPPSEGDVLESWVKMLLFVAQRATHTARSPRGGADNPIMKGVRPGGGNITLDAELYSMLCHIWRGIKYVAPVGGVDPTPADWEARGIAVMKGGDETGTGKRGAAWALAVDFEQAAYALRLYFEAGRLAAVIDAVRLARGGKLPL